MKKILFYALIIDLIIADQLSKWAVSEFIIRKDGAIGLIDWILHAPERLPSSQIEVLPFFNFVMVWNRGISFGLFNSETDYGAYILIALAVVISAGFLVWLSRCTNKMQCFGFSLVVGGALSNALDRVRFGAVMDFLDFHAFGYHWPAFNIADSCIVIGVFILMIHALFFDKPLHTGKQIL